ncbi:Ig-like domain-containing protein [Massilia sp. DD77]|uniref:Ig-like domain-containing protein n=1 Tax=Massilia sp. DD77 TaxID=3109349 RepID=UPI002FFFE5D6
MTDHTTDASPFPTTARTVMSGSMSGGGAAIDTAAVQLLSSHASVAGSVTQIDLEFSTAMAKGAGYVYLTDGAVQTVIDRVSGLPTIRIVGANDTRKILVSDLQVSGNHVIVKASGLAEGHAYNVFMNEGVLLSSTLRSFAGVTVPGTVDFTVVDHGGPSVQSMSLSNSTLTTGAGAELTIVFSEPVSSLPAYALQAANAGIGSLRPVGDGTIWKAALTTPGTVSSSGNQVSLDLAQVRDAAGNAGSGIVLSAAYLVDDGAPPTATITLPDTELLSGEEVEVTITFSEAVIGLDTDAFTAPHVSLSNPVTSDGGKTWTVKMSPNTPLLYETDLQFHVDLSKVLDQAGHAGSGSAVSASYTVDTRVMDDLTGPSVESISFDSYTVDPAHDIVATIVFSEAVQAEGLMDALDADGASLSDLASSDGGKTWTVKLSSHDPDAEPFIGSFDVELYQIADLAGNAGSGAVTSPSFAVNAAASTMFVYDNGVFDNDGVIGDAQRYITGFFFGEFADTSSFTLTIGSETIYNGEIDFYEYEGVLFWSYGGEGYWDEGEYDVVAAITTTGGSPLQTARHVVVDTTAPAIVESPASGVAPPPFDVADGLVVVFDEAVYFTNGEPRVELEIDQNGVISYVDIPLSDAYLSLDRKTLTIPANDHHLPPGASVTMWLPGLEDRAGNNLNSGSLSFETTGGFIDTVAPVATRADAGWLEAMTVGDEVEFSVTFNEPIELTGDFSYYVDMNNGGRADFVSFDENGREIHFRYTVDADDAEVAQLGVADLDGLVGYVRDLAGNVLDNASIDFAVFGDGYGNFIEVDKTAPGALPQPALAAESNTGAANDSITRINDPLITGSGAEPDAQVRIKIDGVDNDDTAYVDENGDWEWQPYTDLAAGVHTLSFWQRDAAGLEGPEVSLTVTIEAFGKPQLDAASDSGASSSDGITNDDTPTYSGSGAVGGRTIKLLANGSEIGETIARADGTWDITVANESALADGTYTITAAEVDAGNERQTDISSGTTLVVDTAAPTSASATADGLGRTYTLSFNETIVFAAGGNVDMYQDLSLKTSFTAGGGNWSKPQDNELLFSMSAFNGLFNMQLSSDAIQDVAGNAAIIGAPFLEFDLSLSS